MSKEDQFCVTLPSNSSYAYYGSQPTNKYRTRLHSHITLPPEDWEVGLAEFSYPRSWACLPNAAFEVWGPGKSDSRYASNYYGKFVVPDTRYHGPQHLADAINNVIALNVPPPPGASGDENRLRVEITADGLSQFKLPKGHMMLLSGELSNPLGFGSEKGAFLCRGTKAAWMVETTKLRVFITEKRIIKSPFVVKVDRLVSDLYLYADIVERQLVGDVLVPLLRTVADTSSRVGEIVTADFRQIHYLPLRIGSFESVDIEVTDTLGRPVRFLFGDITVKLHFRRKKRRGTA